MAKLKVLFLESHYWDDKKGPHTSGVDYARVVNPGRALLNHPDFEVDIRQDALVSVIGKEVKDQSWEDITKNWDIIYTSYVDKPTGYVMLAVNCRKHNTPYVIDLDDNLWEVPKSSPISEIFFFGSPELHIASIVMEDAPYVTTTNQFLKYRINKYTLRNLDTIKVLPNFIDLKVYDYKKLAKKTSGKISIHYFGTGTHYADLFQPNFRNAMTRILKEFPNVEFVNTGLFLVQLKTLWKKQYRHVMGKKDVYDFHTLWGEIMGDADIVVAPLEENSFNRSKSNIKYLEFSAAKKPGVYQNIRQYQELVGVNDGERGFLASREDDWYNGLKKLVESEELRLKMGENAYQFVKDNHSIEPNVEKYAEFFKNVHAEHKKTGHLRNAGIILPESEVYRIGEDIKNQTKAA